MGGGRRVVLGVVGPAHGIAGEVLIRSFTADPQAIASYGAVDIAGRPYEFVSLRPHKTGFVARLKGVADRTAAERLKGAEISVDRDRLPAPEPDEVYHADLAGLAVELADGRPLGRVERIDNYGAGDLLVIRLGDGRQALVPFVAAFVPQVDVHAGRVVVDPPEGLIEE